MTYNPIANAAVFFLSFLAFCGAAAVWTTFTNWRDFDARRRADRRIKRTLDRIIDDYGYHELADRCPDAPPASWQTAA